MKRGGKKSIRGNSKQNQRPNEKQPTDVEASGDNAVISTEHEAMEAMQANICKLTHQD